MHSDMKFIIFCPDHFTGGPAALIQLHGALLDLGLESEVFFYDKAETRFDEKLGRVDVQYTQPISVQVPGIDYRVSRYFDRDSVLIFPENLIEMATSFASLGFKNRVVWWLSYDNAPLKIINRFNHAVNLASSRHIFQSAYARARVNEIGLDGPMVSDYINWQDPAGTVSNGKVNDLCYLASKAPGVEHLINRLRDRFSVITIEKMTPQEVWRTLRETRFFLDFGPQPGKDRVPREAIINDCIPIVRNVGAARFFEDTPLPDVLKIPTLSMANHQFLIDRISRLMQGSENLVNSLGFYKKKIKLEKSQFYREVEFFVSTMG